MTAPLAFLRLGRNADFANRAQNFANRALALPGFPILPAAGVAAAILMVLVGGFGTAAMPLGQRATFWAALMGWSIVKWQIWFALTVRQPSDWARAAALGAIVANLPLPLEIAAALRLVGFGVPADLWRSWLSGLAISAVLYTVLYVARIGRRAAPHVPVSEPVEDGLLARAGIGAPDMIHAIEAEDHYCRVHLAGGGNVLLLYRFGDALGEVAALDGAQVHRGAWVAHHAVRGAARTGRRWLIHLKGGTRIAVSARFVGVARARGWLRPLPRHDSADKGVAIPPATA